MLELQRLLAAYRAQGRDASEIPVFDDAAFRRGTYGDGAVLKFRGIVRDVFDPELVLLSDAADDNGGGNAPEPLVQDMTGDKFVERVPLKIAVVPYVNDWAAQRYQARASTQTSDAVRDAAETSAAGKGTKRANDAIAREEEERSADESAMVVDCDGVKKAKAGSAEEKQAEVAETPAFSEAMVTMYVYDGQYDGIQMDAFKVNESFEFIGVLDLMVLSSGRGVTYDDGFSAQSIAELTISDCLEDIQRKQQSSVVLHCCDVLKIDAVHFVVPHKSRADYEKLHSNQARREALVTQWQSLGEVVDVSSVRKSLAAHLARSIGGDELAAEYMLLCLLSRVYSRPDNATALGNFSVNLSFDKNVPISAMATAIDHVATTLQSVVPMLASVDMSIKSLNEAKFLPHKDYENDVLRGGILQFAHGTTVLVNETVLSAGNLSDQGVKNVGALQSLVEKMLLPYDFQYYSMDFPQDVAVVSLSQGKSILPVHVCVPVTLENSDATISTVATEPMLECFRLYIAVLRSLEVGLGNEQAEIAEKHYVACRKAKQEVSIEDLHRWLRIARLLALSRGDDAVNMTAWKQMLELEAARIARLDDLAAPTTEAVQ